MAAYTSNEFRGDMQGIRQEQVRQTQQLNGIAFTSGASMVFNGLTAMNTARLARAHEQQAELQREQFALQSAMAEQTARHELSMWRQSPDGTVFFEWQQRAAALIPFLHSRDRAWHAAWGQAIGRAQAETPEDERQRLTQYPARLKQNGLKALTIISFTLFGLAAVGLLWQFLVTAMSRASDSGQDFTYADCLQGLGAPDALLSAADCEAINPAPAGPVIMQTVLIALALGAAIFCAILRAKKRSAARLDQTVANEATARTAKWGFDPLTTHSAWYPWHQSQGFTRYAERIEDQVHNGASARLAPAQLISLHIPSPWSTSHALPAEVNDLLALFHEENQSLAGHKSE